MRSPFPQGARTRYELSGPEGRKTRGKPARGPSPSSARADWRAARLAARSTYAAAAEVAGAVRKVGDAWAAKLNGAPAQPLDVPAAAP
jgi:hypothetical protein